MLISTASSALVTMRSEHYYLYWSRALPLIQHLVFASAYLGIATLITQLVLSHWRQSDVSGSRGKGDGVALGAVLLAYYLSGLATALPM